MKGWLVVGFVMKENKIMRYQCWYPAKPGDIRVKTWFAFIPVKIGKNIRWLETVQVEYRCESFNRFLPPCAEYFAWVKHRFLD